MTQTLITRLEKLEGPSRECDAMLHCIATGKTFIRYDERRRRTYYTGFDGHEAVSLTDEPYTSSLDAIVGLIERDLPGAAIGFDNDEDCERPGPNWNAGVYGEGGQAPNPAIALCIAYCKAKQAEGQT